MQLVAIESVQQRVRLHDPNMRLVDCNSAIAVSNELDSLDERLG